MGNSECSVRDAAETCRRFHDGDEDPAWPTATTHGRRYFLADEAQGSTLAYYRADPLGAHDTCQPSFDEVQDFRSQRAHEPHVPKLPLDLPVQVDKLSPSSSSLLHAPRDSGPQASQSRETLQSPGSIQLHWRKDCELDVAGQADDRDCAQGISHAGLDPGPLNVESQPSPMETYFERELGECPADVDLGCQAREWRRFRFSSGATYDGEWLEGRRDGSGKQCWPDGTEYVGQWYQGQPGGRGRIIHMDGDIYTGEWVNGRAHGFGIYRFQDDNAVYEGEFDSDLREGIGIEIWRDGSRYAGEFRKSMKDGYGEHTWPDSTSYAGKWSANQLSGAGKYIAKDGRLYEGQWHHSAINGFGVYTWPSGWKYEGQYVLDKKHGFGVIILPEGVRHESFWLKGEKVCGLKKGK